MTVDIDMPTTVAFGELTLVEGSTIKIVVGCCFSLKALWDCLSGFWVTSVTKEFGLNGSWLPRRWKK
jgi:hypothetical protein